MTLRGYSALLEAEGACALLESTSAPSGLSRISILAERPRAVLTATGDSLRLATDSRVRRWRGDLLRELRALVAATPPGRWPDEGGVVGALAYDSARPGRFPTALHLVALAVDRFRVFEGGGAGEDAPGLEGGTGGGRIDLSGLSNLTEEEHRRLVLRIQEHISAGDIYQANLSRRFALPWPEGGLRLYHHLRRLSPAPFSGYLRAQGLEIVSASPERLLLVDEGVLSTRPIAGTRPRSADPAEDASLAEELILSPKERAEHLMLLDLARNDLGRCAQVGSVHVDEMMTVETYAQVRHIVSNVRARLERGKDALDALMALFPGGTITGVPKKRCMEILDELEPVPRGFYTGSLFYVTPSGRLDANILIRSAVVSGGRLTFHTGSGIVADSDPAQEHAETLHKAEGMRAALEAARFGGERPREPQPRVGRAEL